MRYREFGKWFSLGDCPFQEIFFNPFHYFFFSFRFRDLKKMSFNKNDNYYESYDNIEVHNLMLRDEPRVSLYRKAIMESKDIFKDKV